MTDRTQPWLSVLIPSYERPEGVSRILDTIANEKLSGIDCLVGDDSFTDGVEAVVRNHPLFLEGKVFYQRNNPSLGPVANWNDLLERATGTHIMFMHHDEFPVSNDFFLKAFELLKKEFDCIILNAWITDAKVENAMPHCLGWIKRLILRHAPTYLMRRNVIGAPSMIILRNKYTPRFNSRLMRTVDCDWFCTFLKQPNIRLAFANDLCVASIFYSDSITGKLGKDLKGIALKECELLRNEGKHMPFIKICAPKSNIEMFLAGLDNLLWIFYRTIEYPFRYAMRRPLLSLRT